MRKIIFILLILLIPTIAFDDAVFEITEDMVIGKGFVSFKKIKWNTKLEDCKDLFYSRDLPFNGKQYYDGKESNFFAIPVETRFNFYDGKLVGGVVQFVGTSVENTAYILGNCFGPPSWSSQRYGQIGWKQMNSWIVYLVGKNEILIFEANFAKKMMQQLRKNKINALKNSKNAKTY